MTLALWRAATAESSSRPDTLRIRPHRVPSTDATVSVVITCFNYGHFLADAVNSVLHQEGAAVDVVIVDDCSTDNSNEVARSLAASNPNVKVISNSSNQGVVASFNTGLACAGGEFLVRLDADDLLTPGSLTRAIDVARAFPNVGLVYGHPLHFSGNVLPSVRTRATGWTVWPGRRWLAQRCRSGINVITSPEVLMRKSVVDRVGPQQPLRHSHDMEMWLRIAAFSDVAYIHGADQAWHREHEQSMSAVKVDEFHDFTERIEAFRVLFEGITGTIPGAPRLRRTALAALANEALTAASHEYDCGRGDGPLVESYLDRASQLYPDVESLPAWGGLQRRVSRGSAASARLRHSLLPRAVGRLRNEVRSRRWHRAGV